ncbi:uncharacterized protein LOC129918666 [Episyrphus balteatus]|uniref:uncharacterized protein LOC129918666 n=1 Tax=Episyrphus balteatus TaxID=286459 RepID=UPI00248505ED|nr:uncharacterized protein LOC129918666 [Episyrphus balteatus]
MNSAKFNIENVEELIKSSKHFQNKMRQELRQQSIASSIIIESKKREELTPVESNQVSKLYAESRDPPWPLVERIPPDCSEQKFMKNANESEAFKVVTITPPSSKRRQARTSLSSFKTFASVRTNIFEKPKTKNLPAVQVPAPPKRIKNFRSNMKKSLMKSSKTGVESNKLAGTSSCRFPLQRFAESAKKNIDFFKEHPEIEFEMESESMTLFPRRLQRSFQFNCQSEESLNLVQAEVKSPQLTSGPLKQETWNSIFMLNQPKDKQADKIVRIKKNKSVLQSNSTDPQTHIANRSQVKETDKNYDIITSIPSKGLFTIQQQSDQLAKQKMCHLQRFPVLFIRPDFKVQKLAGISIDGKSESIFKEKISVDCIENVMYHVCSHKGEKHVKSTIILDKVRKDILEKDNNHQPIAKSGNKFFKPLELLNLPEYSSSTSSRNSPASNPSYSSTSSSSFIKHKNSSTTFNDIDPNTDSSLKSVSSAKVKNISLKSPPSRCEVHVQTECDYKKTVSPNTSPFCNAVQSSPQPKITLPTKIKDTANKILENVVTGPENLENSVEYEITANILEGILQDKDCNTPTIIGGNLIEYEITANILEGILQDKDCNTPTIIGGNPIRLISPPGDSQEKKNQKHPDRMVVTNYESNVEEVAKKIAPRLENILREGQGKANYRDTLPQTRLIDRHNGLKTSSSSSVSKQDPLRMDKNAVHNSTSAVQTIKKEEHYNPTDVEINRAVKIFVDSLKHYGYVVEEEKTIYSDIGHKNKLITCPKSGSKNRRILKEYTSSDSSNYVNSPSIKNNVVQNVKTVRSVVRWFGVSESSTLNSLSPSDIESESCMTNEMQSVSINSNDESNISYGEVKSIVCMQILQVF